MASRGTRVRTPRRHLPATPGNKAQRADLLRKQQSAPDLSQPVEFQTPPGKKRLFPGPATPECFSAVLPPTPGEDQDIETERLLADIAEEGEDSCSVTVAVRVRPFSQREVKEQAKCVVTMDGPATLVTPVNGNEHLFAYDHSFWSFKESDKHFASQEKVYRMLAQPLLERALQGYNTCLFAYGQTGSGKSYTMMGFDGNKGIIPRFCEDLFSRLSAHSNVDVKSHIEISFFEIYNEKIHDLLVSSPQKEKRRAPLKVREHPLWGPYVQGLSQFVVSSYRDIEGWLAIGNKQRATAATGMNDKSSRSHSVFTIIVTQTTCESLEGEVHEHSRNSRVNLIDLAGSERSTAAQTSGDRLREGANINKSLMTLGKVIQALADQSVNRKRRVFIPYRDSVLTWLLKESLGGNSRTAMIANISPSSTNMEETLSTLRYAKQARSIVNIVKVNEDPKARLIRELRAEIEKLRRAQTGQAVVKEETYQASLAEIAALKQLLAEQEQRLEEVNRSWQDRLEQAEQQKAEETHILERVGVALKVDNKLPHLVNLNEDPQLAEVLLYILKEGQTRVGSKTGHQDCDIQLLGGLVGAQHCVITNRGDQVMVMPMKDAPTYVNGEQVTMETMLHHGDRLIVGDHYFRFNNPTEAKSGKKKSGGQPIDFEFAKSELISVQRAKLEKEVEAARTQVKKEAMAQIQEARQVAEEEMEEQRREYEQRMQQLQKELEKESVEKKEKEQTAMEVQDKVHQLEEQKKALEIEVLSNRRRLQLEALAVKQSMEEARVRQARIIAELEAEKQRMEGNVSRLQEASRRRQQCGPISVKYGERDQWGLIRLSMLLQEANNISRSLGRNVSFSRQDIFIGDKPQVQVRVSNHALGMVTHWSPEKFESRLVQMRELYQGDGDISEDDTIFCDPSDSWQRDTSVTGLSDYSSGSEDQQKQNGTYTVRPAKRENPSTTSVTSTCLEMINSARKKLKSNSQDSIVDQILYCLQSLKTEATVIFSSKNAQKAEKDVDSDADFGQNMMRMSYAVVVLTSLVQLWASVIEQSELEQTSQLVHQLTNTTQRLATNVGRLLQGFEQNLLALIFSAKDSIKHSMEGLARVVGEAMLATDTGMTCITDISVEILLKTMVIQGMMAFVEKFVGGCVKKLENCEDSVLSAMSSSKFTPGQMKNRVSDKLLNHVQQVTSSARGLLQAFGTLEVEYKWCYSNDGVAKVFTFIQDMTGATESVMDSAAQLCQSTVHVTKNSREGVSKMRPHAVKLLGTCGLLREVANSWQELNSDRRPSSRTDHINKNIREFDKDLRTLLELVDQEARTSGSSPAKRLLPSSPHLASTLTTQSSPCGAGTNTVTRRLALAFST
ncbi:kinesin-like protein KIF14 [Branchiostoma floridae x Branchiostoma belcheri]